MSGHSGGRPFIDSAAVGLLVRSALADRLTLGAGAGDALAGAFADQLALYLAR